MPRRYNNTAVIKDKNRQRRYGSWIISIPEAKTDDIYIQITSADRLDILAGKLYGDQTLWYIIAAANSLGKGSMVVKPGTVLRIPPSAQTNNFINALNEQR